MTTRVWLDRSIGETRALVTVDGRAHRLLIEREAGPPPVQRLGAIVRGRLAKLERGSGVAFVELGEGPAGVLPVSGAGKLAEGAAIEVEVTAEARADKGPALRLIAPAEPGAPSLLRAASSIEARLKLLAPGAEPVSGHDAVERIDAAVEEALATETPLPGGGRLTIEPTRGMVAVDVDAGQGTGQDARRSAAKLNLTALNETARRLRLSALGGLVVVDLIGARHDGDAIRRAAEAAFAPDQPGVVFGPISKFGAFELVRPWRERPLRETLLDVDGRSTPLTAALQLLRALERLGRSEPGARLQASCAPEVAQAAEPYGPRLADRIGHRFQIAADVARPRERPDVRAL